MGNPVTDGTKCPQLKFGECCGCITLRTGILVIGIIQIVVAILYLIGGITGSGMAYVGVVTTILSFVSGVLLCLAYRQPRKDYLFWSVYINLFICVWTVVTAILFFVSLFIALGVGALINAVVYLYFAAIIRSFALDIDTTGTAATNPA